MSCVEKLSRTIFSVLLIALTVRLDKSPESNAVPMSERPSASNSTKSVKGVIFAVPTLLENEYRGTLPAALGTAFRRNGAVLPLTLKE